MSKPTKPNCYECIHRGEVPGSAHSKCEHPATKPDHSTSAGRLIGLLGKRSGLAIAPSIAAFELRIAAHTHGIQNGWFIWPWNFDPVWLQNCEGFKKAEAATEEYKVAPTFEGDDTVIFRTARRRWRCWGGHDGKRITPCARIIEKGSRYIEYLGESPLYSSGMRYHFECAEQHGLIVFSKEAK